MRIISGEFKGRKLTEFVGKDIRPTSDKAREALFSILQNKVEGSDILDLFAGTGSVGFEALSRGASKVVFSDISRQATNVITKNAELLKVKAEVYNIPAMYVLNKLIDLRRQFDIIYLDPPYDTKLGEEALQIIAKNGLLKQNGIAILEKGEEGKKDPEIEGLSMYDKRKYGIATFRFYKMEE